MPDRVVWLPTRSSGSELRRTLGVGNGALVRLERHAAAAVIDAPEPTPSGVDAPEPVKSGLDVSVPELSGALDRPTPDPQEEAL
jgi:NADH-quinone oxidoreductase subunit G